MGEPLAATVPEILADEVVMDVAPTSATTDGAVIVVVKDATGAPYWSPPVPLFAFTR